MDRKRRAVEEEADQNLTPMIDVTFLLLVFFVITLRFKTLERKLDSHLPTDFGSQPAAPLDETFVTVTLDQPTPTEAGAAWRDAGRTRVRLEKRELPGRGHAALVSMDAELAELKRHVPEAKGKIDAGTGVPHASVVTTLDAFARHGYETVTFVGLARDFDVAAGEAWWHRLRRQLAAGR